MQLLLIKIKEIDVNPEYALLGKKQKQAEFLSAEWSKIRSLTRGRRVLLIIPNDNVVLTSVKIPSKNKKQLLRAVPFALEDHLAEDIETLHFAIHQKNSGSDTQVAVINRVRLDGYISLLKKNNITAHFVLPQVLTQAIKRDSWSIIQADSNISMRLNEYYGFSSEAELLDLFIQQLDVPEPKLIMSNLSTDKLPEKLREYPFEEIDAGRAFYNGATSALELNLLTNFISQKKQSNINWKAWRAPLVIASIVVASWVGIFVWQNSLLQKQQRQLQKSIESIYLSTFPGGRIVDPPQQMASKLARLKKNTGLTINSPLPLIADIAPLLKTYKDLTLNEVRYRENKLELVVKAPNITRLETFKKDAVTKAGLEVIINSSTTTANKVEAVLLVSPMNVSSLEKEKA